jgi:hypothetical protein
MDTTPSRPPHLELFSRCFGLGDHRFHGRFLHLVYPTMIQEKISLAKSNTQLVVFFNKTGPSQQQILHLASPQQLIAHLTPIGRRRILWSRTCICRLHWPWRRSLVELTHAFRRDELAAYRHVRLHTRWRRTFSCRTL